MEGTRVMAAALGLAIGSALYALNAIISFQERGFVEPLDVPLALAFAAAAIFTLRRSILAIAAGAALSVLALILYYPSGAMPLIAFWVVVLLLTLQAIPVLRSSPA